MPNRKAGRPMEPFALYETARVNDLAISHELRQMDTWEAAALETLDYALAQPNPDIPACRRILAKLRARDQHENRLHGEIAELWQGANASATA